MNASHPKPNRLSADGAERLAREVLDIESTAIADLKDRIGPAFHRACEICLDCAGRVVVTGMGKSGHVA